MDLTGRVQIHPSPRRLSFSELSSSAAALVSRFNTDVPMLVAKLKHAARALNASDLVPDLHWVSSPRWCGADEPPRRRRGKAREQAAQDANYVELSPTPMRKGELQLALPLRHEAPVRYPELDFGSPERPRWRQSRNK
jgi:hypothetical protein